MFSNLESLSFLLYGKQKLDHVDLLKLGFYNIDIIKICLSLLKVLLEFFLIQLKYQIKQMCKYVKLKRKKMINIILQSDYEN